VPPVSYFGARPGKTPARSDASGPRPLGGVNELVKYAGDVFGDAFAIRGPRIDAEGEVRARVTAIALSGDEPPDARPCRRAFAHNAGCLRANGENPEHATRSRSAMATIDRRQPAREAQA
jgi:hypothetical protein